MSSLIGRSTALAAVAIASMLATAPARAQKAELIAMRKQLTNPASDEQEIVAAITKFLDGIRTRDTTLMRSTVAPGATLLTVGGSTGLGAPSTIDGVIERTGKGTGPGNDERIENPKVQIDDQLATLWANFTLTRAGETTISACGVNLFLLRKGPTVGRSFR
jgi:hypothetical protein